MKKTKENKIIELIDRDTGASKGFIPAYYTPIPDEVFTDYMKDLNATELKTLLAILYKTFGFKKFEDKISISQIQRITNGNRTLIVEALRKLEKLGLIERAYDNRKKGIIKIKLLNTEDIEYRMVKN